MGLSSSNDSFLAAINKILAPCKSFLLQEVNNLLVCANSLEELNRRLCKVLTLCSDNGVQLSRAKVEAGTCLTFAGMLLKVTNQGLEVALDPARIRAIKEYPAPTNLESLRRFLSLTEALCDYNT